MPQIRSYRGVMARVSVRCSAAYLVVFLTALAGCSEGASPRAASSTAPAQTSTYAPSPVAPATAPTPHREDAAADTRRIARSARPGPISLRIHAIGLDRLRVVTYRGTADDRPGTRIQNRGLAATPRGPRGGVGPGEIGNMVVTAHRTTAGKPFGRLPSLRVGAHVFVEFGGRVYDYRIARTLTISFRSERGRARQSAPVPGRLGVPASQPMLTLSTCATPEDHAAGNYWTDALGNPEHRIDKIGVLVDVRQALGAAGS